MKTSIDHNIHGSEFSCMKVKKDAKQANAALYNKRLQHSEKGYDQNKLD